MRRRAFIAGTIPASVGFAGCLGPEHEFVVSGATVEVVPTPFTMEIDVVDARATLDGPARFDISVTNASDRSVRVRTRGVFPFGVLQIAMANPFETEATKLAQLRSDAYEESEHVEIAPGSINRDNTFLEEIIAPGQTISERYTLSGDRLAVAGEYTIYGVFEKWLFEFSHRSSSTWERFHPKTTIHVESAEWL